MRPIGPSREKADRITGKIVLNSAKVRDQSAEIGCGGVWQTARTQVQAEAAAMGVKVSMTKPAAVPVGRPEQKPAHPPRFGRWPNAHEFVP